MIFLLPLLAPVVHIGMFLLRKSKYNHLKETALEIRFLNLARVGKFQEYKFDIIVSPNKTAGLKNPQILAGKNVLFAFLVLVFKAQC